jgi:hypothetical protein
MRLLRNKLAPAGRFAAAEFLVFDEALTMHEAMRRVGFALKPMARVYRDGNHLTVRLVWRRACSGESALLALRVRIAG